MFVAPSHTPSPEMAPPAAPPPEACPASVVLLLEDDRLSQRLVSKIFTAAGHEVLVADTIASGVDLLRCNPHLDLLIVDNQIGAERGWNLVAEVRRRSHLLDLPVVTYTESRDRDVVSKYASLGVRAFHLKPYRAEVLLQELAKAHLGGRRDRFAESPESACRRLKLSCADYAGMLNAAAALLEQDCQTIRRLMLSSNDTRLSMAFRSLGERLPQLGIHVVDTLRSEAERELRRDDFTGCAETLRVLDAVAAIVRHRAMALLSMGDSVAKSVASGLSPVVGGASGPVDAPATQGVASPYIGAILARPIGSLGGLARRLCRQPLFPNGALPPDAVGWRNHADVKPWFEAVLWLDGAEAHPPEDVVAALAAVPDFAPAAGSVLFQTGVLGTRNAAAVNWATIVGKLGVPKAAVLAAAGRVGRLPVTSPLPLAPLRQHAITMMLAGFELGRLLSLTHPHRLAAAALARVLGVWTITVVEPLWAALAMAGGSGAADAGESERAILGMPFASAGARWLTDAGAPRLYADVAAGESSSSDVRISLLLADVIERLAPMVLSEHNAASSGRGKAVPDGESSTWVTLRELGVAIPEDTTELGDMVLTLGKSAAWIAGEIVPR